MMVRCELSYSNTKVTKVFKGVPLRAMSNFYLLKNSRVSYSLEHLRTLLFGNIKNKLEFEFLPSILATGRKSNLICGDSDRP